MAGSWSGPLSRSRWSERDGGDEVVDVDLEHPNLDPVSARGRALSVVMLRLRVPVIEGKS
jgi:hypothetical protein